MDKLPPSARSQLKFNSELPVYNHKGQKIFPRSTELQRELADAWVKITFKIKL